MKFSLRVHWSIILLLLVLPYSLVYCGEYFGQSDVASIFAFIIFSLGLDYLVIYAWFHKGPIKKYMLIIFSVVPIVAVFISFLLVKDIAFFMSNELPTVDGIVSRVEGIDAFRIMLRKQDIYLNTGSASYTQMYSFKNFHTGDCVRIAYLPNTRLIARWEHSSCER